MADEAPPHNSQMAPKMMPSFPDYTVVRQPTATTRMVAKLYPPVDGRGLADMLMGSGQREVRVKMGKLEIWETTYSYPYPEA